MYMSELERLLHEIDKELDAARNPHREDERREHLFNATYSSKLALDLVIGSLDFDKDIETAGREFDNNIEAVQRIFADDALFEAFIKAERRLLEDVGFSQPVLDRAITSMRGLRWSVSDEGHPPTPEELDAILVEVRHELQALLEEFGEAFESLETAEQHAGVWRVVGGTFVVILGAATASANGAAFFLSWGWFGPLAPASASISGTIVSNGYSLIRGH